MIRKNRDSYSHQSELKNHHKINYKEYSQKGFIDKVNPEFIGIAKTVEAYKKERKKNERDKAVVDHQVSYMKKINERLEQSLRKRKEELKYVRSIKNRYLDELKKVSSS